MLGVILVAVLAGGGLFLFAGGERESTCSLIRTGHNMIAEFRGPNADQLCRDVVNRNPDFQLRAQTSPPPGDLMCELRRQETTLNVYDSGIANVYGTIFCGQYFADGWR